MTYRLYCESVAGITASAAHADWLCRLVALIDRADWVRLLVAQMARIPSGGIGYLYLPVPRLGQLFSPDLYRLLLVAWGALGTADARVCCLAVRQWSACRRAGRCAWAVLLRVLIPQICARWRRDRKSTRLNSSHVAISYAVF